MLSGEGYQDDWIDANSLLPLLPQANHIRQTMNLPPIDFDIPEQRKAIVDGVIAAAEDLRLAVLHIRDFAARYEIDPERIVLGGFSAGAVTSWNVAHGMGVPVSGVFIAVRIRRRFRRQENCYGLVPETTDPHVHGAV
ncbi:hypothetical protein QEZ52_13995 [Aliisedimentitalea scapharcae]|uniref:BD-FAE-like domain-containing protein n=1 Tax=Aliisedimentitalea scapharcae TaxID=1524259 RepID=A0ABZ2XNQ1_9RHOB